MPVVMRAEGSGFANGELGHSTPEPQPIVAMAASGSVNADDRLAILSQYCAAIARTLP